MIRRLPFLTAALLAAALGGDARAASAPAPPAAPPSPRPAMPEIERLEAELARLRAELTALRQSQAEVSAARLEALEAEVARLEGDLRRLAEESRANASAVDEVAKDAERRTSVTVYGDFQAIAYAGEDAVFDGRSFEVVLSGHPHRRLSYFGEVEFEQVAGVGGERGGEIVVEQAWASFQLASVLHLRAGVLLVPFGNVNIDHFAPKREVVTKPLVSYVVAPSDWTDNGIGVTGQRAIGAAWLVNYEAYAVAGLGTAVDGLGMRGARQGYGVDNNANKALVGRVGVARAGRLQAGLSGYEGRYDDAGQRPLRGWAVDALVRAGPLKVTGEVNEFLGDRGSDPSTHLRGGYLRVVLDVAGAWLSRRPVARDFDEPRLALVGQYDEVRLDGPVDGAYERNRERRTTAGLNFRPSGQWVLKLTWEWNDASARPLVNGDRDGFVGAIGFVF